MKQTFSLPTSSVLAQRFEEKQALHVADGAADLGDQHVHVRVVGGDLLDAGFDLIGDVRDELHGLAEVFAAALLLDHGIETWPEVRLFMRESTPEVKRS
jgi:hypothetical protein